MYSSNRLAGWDVDWPLETGELYLPNRSVCGIFGSVSILTTLAFKSLHSLVMVSAHLFVIFTFFIRVDLVNPSNYSSFLLPSPAFDIFRIDSSY